MVENGLTIIVGAGVAGLACAKKLQSKNKPFLLLDKSDAVGGRIRTDEVDGFLLDRGFQVLLDSYPECQEQLDYAALELKPFKAGSKLFDGTRHYEIFDPQRASGTYLKTLFSPVGSLGDKIKMLKLKKKVGFQTVTAIFKQPEQSTLAFLQERGFSDKIIEKFFKPFYGGVFLESELNSSARMFCFTFKMFSEGAATLPREGMQAIPEQMAATLPKDSLRLNTEVETISKGVVQLKNGEMLHCENVVVANWDQNFHGSAPKQPRASTRCMYFQASQAPFHSPMLALNAGDGVINHIAIPTNLHLNYAPKDKVLLSVTLKDEVSPSEDTVAKALQQLYPDKLADLKHIKSYEIADALPNQSEVRNYVEDQEIEIEPGVYQCGDYLLNGSINAAMKSGRLAAECILHK